MKYRTIVADPPWPYPEGFSTQSRTRGRWTGPARRRALPYPAMTLEAIAALPVTDYADRHARLFLWATNRYLEAAFGVLRAWGFAYRQALTWKKLDALSGSVAPNSEFLLVGVRGVPARRRRLPSAVIECAQTKTHSRKPEVFLDAVEQVSPGPYLELFARRQRLGWDTWGDEALDHLQPSPEPVRLPEP